MTIFPVLISAFGAALILIIVWDAFETILVPRRIGRRVRLTRYFYLATWRVWRAVARRVGKPSRREALLGFYGPLSLLMLLSCWAVGLIVAFALLELGTQPQVGITGIAGTTGMTLERFGMLLYMSGETFFTLGFGDVTPTSGAGRLLAVLEAGLGFGFLGTVIGYLPTMYAAFAQREVQISLMDARAGSPPTAAAFLGRVPEGSGLCDELLEDWERWSAQLLETHISYPQLAFYRSQHSNQSWLAALTAILDSTALLLARPDAVPTSQAKLTFAMARHALVDITQNFVRDYAPGAPDRLTPDTLRLLRERLAHTAMSLPESGDFESRLGALRLKYEPYAQALAAWLLFELPPWVHAEQRRDNWQGGPWDKRLSAHPGPVHRSDDHF